MRQGTQRNCYRLQSVCITAVSRLPFFAPSSSFYFSFPSCLISLFYFSHTFPCFSPSYSLLHVYPLLMLLLFVSFVFAALLFHSTCLHLHSVGILFFPFVSVACFFCHFSLQLILQFFLGCCFTFSALLPCYFTPTFYSFHYLCHIFVLFFSSFVAIFPFLWFSSVAFHITFRSTSSPLSHPSAHLSSLFSIFLPRLLLLLSFILLSHSRVLITHPFSYFTCRSPASSTVFIPIPLRPILNYLIVF